MSVSVNRFGNTSAASIPLSIQQELENGRIKDDDTLVLSRFRWWPNLGRYGNQNGVNREDLMYD